MNKLTHIFILLELLFVELPKIFVFIWGLVNRDVFPCLLLEFPNMLVG